MLQGYYSLIQYCPDWTRLEVCNIGVMLFCPEIKFLEVKMTRGDTKRIRAIFGKDHSLDHIQTFKNGFADRIHAERDRLSGLEALKSFIANRANSFLITEPRSIAVGEPNQELADLFKEIFGETLDREKKKQFSAREQLYQTLEKAFGTKLNDRVVKDLPTIDVAIPGFHKTVKPCMGFLDGSFNLVVERKLTPTDSFSKMSSVMMIGRFVSEKEDERWGKQRLIILADTGGNSEVRQQIDTFRPLMREHQTDICTITEMGTRVITESQPLSASPLPYLNQRTQST